MHWGDDRRQLLPVQMTLRGSWARDPPLRKRCVFQNNPEESIKIDLGRGSDVVDSRICAKSSGVRRWECGVKVTPMPLGHARKRAGSTRCAARTNEAREAVAQVTAAKFADISAKILVASGAARRSCNAGFSASPGLPSVPGSGASVPRAGKLGWELAGHRGKSRNTGCRFPWRWRCSR